MKTSSQWLEHFKQNSKHQRVDWSISPRLDNSTKKALLYSLKAWQKGETSEGEHLKIAARKYAQETDDLVYVRAIELFIKEEQKHGENLGRYIDALGEKRVDFDLGDQVFRYVRGWNKSITSWTMAVIIIEQAAQLFYQALKDAAQCPLMDDICTDILIDEAYHIDFQNERLALIMSRKHPFWRAQYLFVFKVLFEVTYRTIWFAHSKAFKQGSINKTKFKSRMRFKFKKTVNYVRSYCEMPILRTIDS